MVGVGIDIGLVSKSRAPRAYSLKGRAMNARIVVTALVLLSSACAATKKEDVYVPPYAERAPVIQPAVSRQTFDELSGKQVPLCIGGIARWTFYNASVIGKVMEEKKEQGKVHFTTDPVRFPPLKGVPSTELAEFFGLYRVFLKKELEQNKFQVVETPCKSRLEIGGAFAYFFYSGKGDPYQGAYVLASPIVRIGEDVVLVTPDDYIAKGRRLRMEYLDIVRVAEFAAYMSAKEIRHFWDETYGQK